VLRGTGTLSPERKEYLDGMRQQLGLQQATADKIIREVGGEVVLGVLHYSPAVTSSH
jgi:hypothetical protein